MSRTVVLNTGLTPPEIVAILIWRCGMNEAESTSTFTEGFLHEIPTVDTGSRFTTFLEGESEGNEKMDTRPLAEIASNWSAERERDRTSESSEAEKTMRP